MKKLALLSIFLFSISNLYAHQIDNERRVRDSIFQIVGSIQVDSLRVQFLRGTFEEYIDKESATEYLDSAIAISIRKGLHNEELWALFNYCRFYEYRTDIIMMQKRLIPLKEVSYRYGDYAYYYTIWFNLLQARCALGDTEYVIIQAKEMRQEAIRLKYKGGEFIASLALAQAYNFNGDTEEAINTYKQALKLNPAANNEALQFIHGNMGKLYQKQKMYPQALKEFQLQHDALTKIEQGPPSTFLKSLFLGVEIAICKIYLETNDKENLNLHLKKATEYYNESTPPSAYIDYHALWASYYKQTGEWDKCLNEYSLAIAACKGSEPFYENKILRQYADALLETGKYEEAGRTYRTAILREDSLKQDMLQRHQEAHQANFKIQNALLEKEQLTKRHLYIQGGAGIIILLVLVLSIIRAIHIHRQLKKSEEDTRLALETVEAADKMKDRFLHNITHEIRIPLNTVVGFAELLSSEELTEEELTEYSTVIKKNSAKLLLLINNILDLSRLEAGMMRFNVQENDVVQLCREAKMMVEMATPNIVKPIFSTELEELSFNIDCKWFLKLLTTLLSVPLDYNGEPYTIEYELSKENGTIIVLVKNSPLYQCWEDEQEQNILHNINRLYVESFKGSYEVLEKEGMKVVFITHPIS